jgi:hypothetical protein
MGAEGAIGSQQRQGKQQAAASPALESSLGNFYLTSFIGSTSVLLLFSLLVHQFGNFVSKDLDSSNFKDAITFLTPLLFTMSTETPIRNASDASYEAAKHYLSLALVITTPILIAMPPRKLDKYTVFLGSAGILSANQLYKERTGVSALSKLNPYSSSLVQHGLSAPTNRAAEVKERLRLEKEERLVREGKSWEENNMTPLKKVWMGGEKEGWKERRLREEQEAIDQGKGYGSLIMDQLYEVWHWRKRGEEEGRNEEEVVQSLEKKPDGDLQSLKPLKKARKEH